MDITFTKAAWDTLKSYFEAAYQQLGDLELQGYGRIRMEAGEPVCYEVGIPEQEVSTTKTDASWDQMLAFLQERIDFKDVKRAKREVPTWRLWWHTHGRGGLSVSYSGTDEDTIRAMAEEADDHMWGLVFHTDSMASSLYLVTQRPVPIYASLGKAICEEDLVDVPTDITEEVALKVSKKTYPTAQPSKVPGLPSYPRQPNYVGPYKHLAGCLCLVCKQLAEDAAEDAEAERGYPINSEYLGRGMESD